MNIILRNLSKQYNNIPVLNQLNLEIMEGRVSCIMGPSGKGKTTLLHLLMGLVKPDSGRIDGIKGKKFAAVFQEDRLCENVNAIQNIKMVCNRKVTDIYVTEELKEVGLAGYEEKRVSELSGGMKRRVAIVRAVMAESDILIMDEPFKGLDDELKKQVIQYIKDKTAGKTLIVVTHNLEEANALSAKIILLGADKGAADTGKDNGRRSGKRVSSS